MKKKFIFAIALLICCPYIGMALDPNDNGMVAVPMATDLVLDNFNIYADDSEIGAMYTNSGWLGTGTPYISTGGKDGSQCMKVDLTFDGTAWGGGAVTCVAREPFSLKDGQMVTLDIKGDSAKLTDGVLVFQFRDQAGEVIRVVNSVVCKSPDWVTINMPYKIFEEGPYDANPDVPADRDNLVSWEFYVQGIGGTDVEPFEASVYVDNLTITDVPAPVTGDRVLDLFEYASDAALSQNYLTTVESGRAVTTLSTDKTEGTHSMKLALSFLGTPWSTAGVNGIARAPFVFKAGQKVSYSIKGDPSKLTNSAVLMVFQFQDSSGEIMRYLDSVGPISSEWTTVEIPYEAFQESPWDAKPETAADRNNLVSWGFLVQGVGETDVPAFTANILIDNLVITSAEAPAVTKNYTIKKIETSKAPVITDNKFDAVYASVGNEISTWEDDSFSPVKSPYDKTRAYLLTDGTTLYVGMIVGAPDTGKLKSDTANDTLQKWNADSWEIVFAPNPEKIDGQNYIKFAGDSAGYYDISPDAAGGTDWNAPSFKSHAYIIDKTSWAAEFSVAIADIKTMFTEYDSYGHIGIQEKSPDINYAWPDRASFGSRNGHWDFSELNPAVPVGNWDLY